MQLLVDYKTSINQEAFFYLLNLSWQKDIQKEDISRDLNFDSDSDDSNDKLEKLFEEDSGSDLEFTLNRPRKSYIIDSDSDSLSDSDNLNERKCKKNCKL